MLQSEHSGEPAQGRLGGIGGDSQGGPLRQIRDLPAETALTAATLAALTA